MPDIQTQIEIDAAPPVVWAILTDFAAYPDWNPLITSIEGDPVVGERLRVRVEPPGGRATTFSAPVRRVESARELRWRGYLGVPQIFAGEESFRLAPTDSGGTTFHHDERFSGVLAVPMLWVLRTRTEQGFEAMNAALKARAERVAQD